MKKIMIIKILTLDKRFLLNIKRKDKRDLLYKISFKRI